MRRLAAVLCLPVLLLGCTAAGPTDPVESATRTLPAASAITKSPSPSNLAPASPAPVSPSPALDRWVEAGRFEDYRVVTQLALLGTGDVLAVGDDNACGVENAGTDSAELWEIGVETWRLTDRLPTPRTIVELVGLADGRALVTGGANAEYVAKSSTVVFDPGALQWSSSGLLNTARMSHVVAALPDGGALVAGGLLIDQSQEGRALDSAEVWDPGTGAWSRVAPMSTVRLGAVAVTLADGRVLVVGGEPSWGADVVLATAEIYDPATGEWSPAGELGGPRRGFTVVALPDGGALAVGGERSGTAGEEGGFGRPPATDAERFDATTGTWSVADGWQSDSGRRPAAVKMRDGRVLVVDGPTTTVYDPVAATWTPTVPIPGGRYDGAAVLLADGSVIVGGGWSEWPPTEDTPSCPTADVQTWRFVPGS